MSAQYLQEIQDGARLWVHLVPGAKRDAIAGEHGGRLKISVTALPLEGRANRHLIAFLAKALKLPKRAVQLQSGETSRDKTLIIRGLTPTQITAKLNL